MDLEDIMLREVNQMEKDKYCMITCMRKLKKAKIKKIESRMVVSSG